MAELNDNSNGEDELGVELSTDGPSTVVRIAGDVDISTCNVLREALRPVYDLDASHTVIFDLSAATFFDSSGLAVLIELTRSGRTVWLRKPSPTLRRVVEATGLAEILAIEP